MAQTFTQLLADKFTYHAVDISRFEAHVQTSMIQTLKDLEASIVEDLVRLDPTATAMQRRRLEALQKSVRANIQDAYSGLKRDGRKDLLQLAETVSTSTAETINLAAKVSLLNVGLPAEMLASLADDSLIQGAPAREWWSRQAGNMSQRFNNTVREGVFRGEPLSELVSRVRGKKEFDYKDGIMEAGRRDAEALIRTSIQSVANSARLQVMQDNPDVIKGIQALTVLDARTTELCMGRSGFSWYLDDGRPMDGDTNIDFPGPPPWHFNCRTVLVPVTFSWEELAGNKDLGKAVQQEVDALPKSTQASMDGQVASDMTYEDWLKTKPEPFQKDILGDAKWEMWNNGELPLRDMIDQRGRPLTIDQLAARLKDGPVLPTIPATPPPPAAQPQPPPPPPAPIPDPPKPVEPPPAPKAKPEPKAKPAPATKVKPAPPEPPAGPAGPEWKPTMTQAEADAFTQDSVLKDQTFYHFTNKAAVKDIMSSGFNIGDGSVYGRGVHVTSGSHGMNTGATGIKPGEARSKVRVKINAAKVLDTTTPEAFAAQLKKMGATGADMQDPASFLQRQGYDAIRINRGAGNDVFITVLRREHIVAIEGKDPAAVAALARRTKAAPLPPRPAGSPNWTKATPGYEWHDATMRKAPAYIQNAVGRLPPVDRVTRLANVSYYQPAAKPYINMNAAYDIKSETHQDVWRHEYGHHLDEMLGRASGRLSGELSASRAGEAAWRADGQGLIDRVSDSTVKEAQKRGASLVSQMRDISANQGAAARDLWVKDVFSQAGLNYTEFDAMMNTAINKAARLNPIAENLRMLAAYERGVVTPDMQALFFHGQMNKMGAQFMDAAGAVTKNKIGFGHSDVYYNKATKYQGFEAFANTFSALSHANPTFGKLYDRFFPNLTRLIRGALENV